jgi:hypothetical protein
MDRRAEIQRWLEWRDRQGLTFKELSAESGVPVGTLAFWAWKLRQERGDGRRKRSASSEPTRADFVELVPTGPTLASTGSLEILLAQGRRIVVTGVVDEDQLVRVVRALARC